MVPLICKLVVSFPDHTRKKKHSQARFLIRKLARGVFVSPRCWKQVETFLCFAPVMQLSQTKSNDVMTLLPPTTTKRWEHPAGSTCIDNRGVFVPTLHLPSQGRQTGDYLRFYEIILEQYPEVWGAWRVQKFAQKPKIFVCVAKSGRLQSHDSMNGDVDNRTAKSTS